MSRRRKKTMIAVIFIIAAAIVCFLLFGKLYPASKMANSTAAIHINAQTLSGILSEKLGQILPINNFDLMITPDGKITMSADIARDDIVELIKENDISVSRLTLLSLRLLPDKVPASLTFKAVADPENHIFYLEPVSLKLSKFTLTGDQIPQSIYDFGISSILSYLTSNNLEVNDIKFGDGEIIIS